MPGRPAESSNRRTYRVDAYATGARVRARRLELGLTQREAAFPGCSYAYISRFERGERTPTLGVLVELAGRLDTTALYLATGDGSALCPVCNRGEAARWALELDGDDELVLVLDDGRADGAELVEHAAADAGVPLRRLS